MTLVRHFEAAVFPLVLHLRRSLFADLSAFASEAVAALSAAGANGPDSGATQREEQVSFFFFLRCLFVLLVLRNLVFRANTAVVHGCRVVQRTRKSQYRGPQTLLVN